MSIISPVLFKTALYYVQNMCWECHENVIANLYINRVTKLEIAATLYTPQTLSALGRYQQHLRETRVQLDERSEIAIEELRRYGDVEGAASEPGSIDRSSTLAEIARRYGVLAKEVEGVKMEIARLGE